MCAWGPRPISQKMKDFLIRSETASDIRAIRELTAREFLDAPHSSHTDQFIVDALRDGNALSVSLVAEEQDEIVGHIAISPIAISDGSTGWYGLGPVSVLPAHQRRGVGSCLVRSALDRLRDLKTSGCVLLGDPMFYSRFGFRQQADLVLPGMPSEYFQTISFDSSRATGNVEFHAAFSATG